MIEFDELKNNQKIQDLHESEEERLAQILSAKYGVAYIDLTGVAINTDALKLVPEAMARENEVAVFRIVGKKLDAAVFSPNNQKSLSVIEDLTQKGFTVTTYMSSHKSLRKAWDRYKDLSFASESKSGSLEVSNDDVEAMVAKIKTLDDLRKEIEETLTIKKAYKTSRMLTLIMAGSMSTKASDVHIEPEEEYTRIRYRLDGVLIDVCHIDTVTYNMVLSRIKLLSGLKLNIKNNAQDGRFSVHLYGDDIEIRTSTLPGAYGESVVMRLLNPKSINVKIEDLGIQKNLFDIIMHQIAKPNGMILTTGPTGSGKTTTLYSFLRYVHTPEIKIITIEDPIEYHLEGIVQTQTDAAKGYTFANGLRSTLRQDPDIIMVGEIRDNETAEIAINSALTGHLVFSTLHTNNAAGTFPRLVDLGVNPRTMSSAMNISIAQRLVRVLCKVCKEEQAVTEKQKALIATINEKVVAKGFSLKNLDTYYIAKGCIECHNTGYKGRVGVYEAIVMNQAIEDAVAIGGSEREVMVAAEGQNILTLREDGIVKVMDGTTSFDELERVIDVWMEN